MAASTSPIFTSVVNTAFTKFQNADGTNKKTVFTAGSNGSRLEALTIGSNGTSTNRALIYLSSGGIDYLLADVPISAPISPAVAVNVNALSDFSWAATMDGSMLLKSGDSIKVALNAAVTSGKETSVHAIGGDY